MSKPHQIVLPSNSTEGLTQTTPLKLFQPSAQTFITGNSTARAYLTLDIIKKIYTNSCDSNFLIVVSSEREAEQLCHDLFSLESTMLKRTSALDATVKIEHFCDFDSDINSTIPPSYNNSIQRLGILQRCLIPQPQSELKEAISTNQINIVVAALNALLIKAESKNLVKESVLQFVKGAQLPRSTLLKTLYDLGYRQSPVVSEPGQFTIRGSIVDIYSALHSNPIRVDFFDDEIEQIHFFDTETQRNTSTALQSVSVTFADEVRINDSTIPIARQQIKAHCDTHDIPKKLRDYFFEQLELNIFNRTIVHFQAAFREHSSVALDYFDNFQKVFFDPLYLANRINTAQDQRRERFYASKSQKISHKLLPNHPDSVYEEFTDHTLEQLKAKALMSFEVVAQEVEDQSNQNTTAIIAETPIPSLSTPQQLVDLCANNKTATIIMTVETPSERDRYLELFGHVEKRPDIIVGPSAVSSFHINTAYTAILLQTQIQAVPIELIYITNKDLPFFRKRVAKRAQQKSQDETLQIAASWALEEFQEGSYAIHRIHGLGRYMGLKRLSHQGVSQDYLALEYANNDKLYLPIYRLDSISPYIHDSAITLTLDKLGTSSFERKKDSIKAELQALANHLLDLYAKRSVAQGHAFSLTHSDDYNQFVDAFPYLETPDQMKAIEDTLHDMQSPKIMDRLICGDVGFGKTEVAMRASFCAVSDSKQVAVLVPTTLLAMQHEASFMKRFENFPYIRIASVSRLKNKSEIKRTLDDLSAGKVDIIIGTHRLLSKDIKFKDLGLLVIDEEQRFGVAHKERLKTLKINTDALTLSATPIPRTLQLAMLGLRDISTIKTPPLNRQSVKTIVSQRSDTTIYEAISSELSRGGQVFFLHNRVQSIYAVAQEIQRLVPDAKIIVAHGQLSEDELENKMIEFIEKRANILICTTIIENGIDVPNANTIVIDRADTFGLSQLYQIRGRVGRSDVKAYCYLLLSENIPPTEDALKRLHVLQRYTDLGSGFKIASHDLELRGGGDILGRSQSGHIAAVGYEMYIELLREVISEQGHPQSDSAQSNSPECEIKIPVPAYIPETYLPDEALRLQFYRKFSKLQTEAELRNLEVELLERCGPFLDEIKNLITLIEIKLLIKNIGALSLTVSASQWLIEISEHFATKHIDSILIYQSQSKNLGLKQGTKQEAGKQTKSLIITQDTAFKSLTQTLFELESFINNLNLDNA